MTPLWDSARLAIDGPRLIHRAGPEGSIHGRPAVRTEQFSTLESSILPRIRELGTGRDKGHDGRVLERSIPGIVLSDRSLICPWAGHLQQFS